MVDGNELMKLLEDGRPVRSLCKEYNLTVRAFYKLVEPLGYRKKTVSPEYDFFSARLTKTWEAKNRILFGLILLSGKTMTETAEEIGVDIRTLERWIYDGVIPKQDRMESVCAYFDYPAHVLFYEVGWDGRTAQKEDK